MRALLTRLRDDSYQTLGRLTVFDGIDMPFQSVTLEPPYKNNENRISCIPAGIYRCVIRYSEKYDWHFLVEDTDHRELILLHWGNFRKDTLGCILIATFFSDINEDGKIDIARSKSKFEEFVELMPEEFDLHIIDI